MTRDRLALGLTVAGLVLAAAAVATGRREVTWAAIGVLSAAFILRRVGRRTGSP